MGSIANFTQGILSAVGAGNYAWDDRIKKEADYVTMTNQIKLQNKINAKLLEIRQNNKYDTWNDEISHLFDEVKGDMNTPGSDFYCRNQLQADMFNKILIDSHSRMSYQVAQMAIKKQSEERIVEAEKAKEGLRQQGVTGREYQEKADKIDSNIYDLGDIGYGDLEARKQTNKNVGYTDSVNNLFNNGYYDAISKNETFENYWNKIEQETNRTNDSSISKEKKEELKQQAQAKWNAGLKELQQSNADKLAAINVQLSAAKTSTEEIQLAEYGQRELDKLKDTQLLSEEDKNKYAALFKLAIANAQKASSSGNDKEYKQSFENAIKAAPEQILQLCRENKLNFYDGVAIWSKALVNEWFETDERYKEQTNKSYRQLKDDFDIYYAGDTSEQALTDVTLKQIKLMHPTIEEYVKEKVEKLQDDIKKNPKLYQGKTTENIALYMADMLMETYAGTPDVEIKTRMDKMINDCYIESIKYLELDKDNKLKKTYNVNKPNDVASAAQLTHDKDYVFTYNGTDFWAPGKKEALEAEGGIVDVLNNAVAGTMGFTEEDYKGFMYKASLYDKESVPIFRYGDKAYEVVATENGKNYKIIEYSAKVDEDGIIKTDKDGLPTYDFNSGKEIEGNIPGKKERREIIRSSKTNEKQAAQQTATIKKEREEEYNNNLVAKESIPYAVKAAGIDKADWDNLAKTGRTEDKQYHVNVTINKIKNAAKPIEKIKDEEEKQKAMDKFYDEWHIYYSDWMDAKTEEERQKLILKT